VTQLWVVYLTKELLHLGQTLLSEVLVRKEMGAIVGRSSALRFQVSGRSALLQI
jgi:hypothetical protein